LAQGAVESTEQTMRGTTDTAKDVGQNAMGDKSEGDS
jgi:hypothetical protein